MTGLFFTNRLSYLLPSLLVISVYLFMFPFTPYMALRTLQQTLLNWLANNIGRRRREIESQSERTILDCSRQIEAANEKLRQDICPLAVRVSLVEKALHESDGEQVGPFLKICRLLIIAGDIYSDACTKEGIVSRSFELVFSFNVGSLLAPLYKLRSCRVMASATEGVCVYLGMVCVCVDDCMTQLPTDTQFAIVISGLLIINLSKGHT